VSLNIVDRGSGVPIVVIPGVQGRWEWMQPAIDALAARCRVITFSLADEPASGGTFDERVGFWCYVHQVREVLDTIGVGQATICGVSYGGLIAAAFAARHPERTSSLVLVSALPPTWTPNARLNFYLAAPRLLTPLFLLGSLRLYREIAAAAGETGRLRLALGHAWRALTHMFSPSRMARRVRLLEAGLASGDLRQAIGRVTTPTLIVTGESGLDRVVPVEATLQYARLWPHASVVTIQRTGHLGLSTRPEIFADLLVRFAEGAAGDSSRRHVG
jgi:pimeloyl-ACP methyl ester carboxylesterase